MRTAQARPVEAPRAISRSRSTSEYVAAPVGPARATVAVLHAWWGLTDVVTGVCDDLAELGYVAVAPDLYAGERATTPEGAAALRARRRSTPMWRQIVASIEKVRSRHGATAVGLIGFSMGGHWALWLASQARPEVPPIAATVVFYATRACDFSTSRSAFQFHLAESDPFVSGGGVRRLERQLRAAGRDAEFHRYQGTGHWFFEWDRPEAHDAEAAALAWQRTVEFLERHLHERSGATELEPDPGARPASPASPASPSVPDGPPAAAALAAGSRARYR